MAGLSVPAALNQTKPARHKARAAIPARAQAVYFQRVDCEGDASDAEPGSPIQRSSSARSRALCQRSSGSLAKHFLSTRSSDAGVRGWVVLIGFGSAVRIAAIKLARLFPLNAGWPVNIS